jgi:hypothetical protein
MTFPLKFLAAVAVAGTLLAAAPAAAQYRGQPVFHSKEAAKLHAEFQRGLQRGTIDRYEAARIERALQYYWKTERRFARNGLSRDERRQLDRIAKDIRSEIRFAERNGPRTRQARYDPRYGR